MPRRKKISPSLTLLIIDDDSNVRSMLCAIGERMGFKPFPVASFEDLRASFGLITPSVIILDLMLGASDGVEVLKFLAGRVCFAPVILITGYDKLFMDAVETKVAPLGLNIVAKVPKSHLKDIGQVLEKFSFKPV